MLGEHRRILLVAERLASINQDLRIGEHPGANEPRPDQLRRREYQKRGRHDRADHSPQNRRSQSTGGRLFYLLHLATKPFLSFLLLSLFLVSSAQDTIAISWARR